MQQQQEQQLQAQQIENNLKREDFNKKLELDKYVIDANNQNKIDLELLRLGVQAYQLGEESVFKELTQVYQGENDAKKQFFENRAKAIELSLKSKEIELKDKEIDSKERISQNTITVAKTNPS